MKGDGGAHVKSIDNGLRINEVDAGVQAVERFGTFLFPRSVHLSGFIEETGRCTERGKNVFISTACTHGSDTERND